MPSRRSLFDMQVTCNSFSYCKPCSSGIESAARTPALIARVAIGLNASNSFGERSAHDLPLPHRPQLPRPGPIRVPFRRSPALPKAVTASPDPLRQARQHLRRAAASDPSSRNFRVRRCVRFCPQCECPPRSRSPCHHQDPTLKSGNYRLGTSRTSAAYSMRSRKTIKSDRFPAYPYRYRRRTLGHQRR